MFLYDKSLEAATYSANLCTPLPTSSILPSGYSAYTLLSVCRYMYMEARISTRHFGASELLRTSKPLLPTSDILCSRPSISHSACYITNDEACIWVFSIIIFIHINLIYKLCICNKILVYKHIILWIMYEHDDNFILN